MPNLDRRQFLQAAAAGAASAAKSPPATSETMVSSLYGSLTAEQKQAICFEYDNPLRSKVENSWLITPHKVGEFFKPDNKQ